MKIKFKVESTEAETNSFKPFRTEYKPANNLYVELEVAPEHVLHLEQDEITISEEGMSAVLTKIAAISSKAYELSTTLGGVN